MSRKSFKSNPALKFISQNNEVDEETNISDTMTKKSMLEEYFKATQSEQTVQEVHEAQEEQGLPREQEEVKEHSIQKIKSTQGRKGEKLPRINMGFQESNLEYLRTISRIRNKSITAYVNELVYKDSIKNADLIEQARKLINS